MQDPLLASAAFPIICELWARLFFARSNLDADRKRQ